MTDAILLPAHRLACAQVWGGNNIADVTVEVPGLLGWVHSRPLYPAATGGDVYYLGVCSQGLLSRIVLADVAGHGQVVSAAALTLRNLLRKHMDAADQSVLMQEMNEAFRREDDPKEVQYATAAVLGYCCATGELIFTNAGHPPPLWYHAREKTWHWLSDETPYSETRIEGVPLGLLPGTDYLQSAVRLGPGDFLVLYTDGLSESTNDAGSELGYHGMLGLAESLLLQSGTTCSAMGQALLSAVKDFRGCSPALDDESMVVLQQTMDNQASYASQSLKSEIWTYEDRAGT